MSAQKRIRQRHEDAPSAASPRSANKRQKTGESAHVPAGKSGLDFLFDEDARDGRKLGAKFTNGVPSKNTAQVNESNAIVAPSTAEVKQKGKGASQPEIIDISSGEEESDELEEEDGEDDEAVTGAHSSSTTKAPVNGHISPVSDEQNADSGKRIGGGKEANGDIEMGGTVEETAEEPSLGDMLLARHPDPIDVADSFADPLADSKAMVPSTKNALSVPSANSLGTVLTQALRTNDKDLLESCFQTSDKSSIRATVQRLQSQHVATLLTRLSERIHKRPGRTGNLLVWIQWSLVAHGGYLSSQPDVMRQLASLQSVIRERANGLQPLLHVKGKLDMLSAQLDLRRDLQQTSHALNGIDDEDAVIYVEGQEDNWSSSEGEEQDEVDTKMIDPVSASKKGKKATLKMPGPASASDGSEDEEMPTTNGFAHHEDDEESGSEADEQDGMLDVEAEVTDDDDAEEDSGDDASEDEASEEEEMSDDESEEEIKPAKPTKLNRKR